MGNGSRPFTVLVVDDSEEVLEIVKATLGADYLVKCAQDGRSGLRLAIEKPRPDLILLDVDMPVRSGYDVCKALKTIPATADMLVVFLAESNAAQDVVRGFELGAVDYFPKPIVAPVLAARVRTFAEMITRRSRQEELIRDRSTQLEQTRLQLIQRLACAMEYHESSAVSNRVVRLGHYARHLAQAAGAEPALCDLMMKAAPLHDIGKLGVPAQVLRRAGKLSAPELEQIKRHPEIGAKIIGEHDDPLLKLARTLALTHHERWDGYGYPSGTRGNDIPWPGRVMAVVDAFEGMTTTQFYHQSIPPERAAGEVMRESGKQFDPLIVEAFRKALPAFCNVHETYADELGNLLNLDFSDTPSSMATASQEPPADSADAAAAEKRTVAQADATQLTSQRSEPESLQEVEWTASAQKAGARTETISHRRITSRPVVYSSMLVAVAVAAAVLYFKQPVPQPLPPAQKLLPHAPIATAPQQPIAALATGTPLKLRLDHNIEELARR